MAKDNLSDAIFRAGDKKRGDSKRRQRSARSAPKARRGRPKAFDTFHTLSMVLLAIGLALQTFALIFYS